MAETAFSPKRGIEVFPLNPDHPGHPLHDKLCDSIPPSNGKGGTAVIDEENANLSPVVCVDRSRGIHQCYSVVESQSAAGPNLSLKTRREGDGESGGNPHSFSRLDDRISRHGRVNIHPCGMHGHIAWKWQSRTTGKTLNGQFQDFHVRRMQSRMENSKGQVLFGNPPRCRYRYLVGIEHFPGKFQDIQTFHGING